MTVTTQRDFRGAETAESLSSVVHPRTQNGASVSSKTSGVDDIELDSTVNDSTDLPSVDLAQKDALPATSVPDAVDEEAKPDVIPDGGYGWVNVGCLVAQNSVTWGRFGAPIGSVGGSRELIPDTRHKHHVRRLLGILLAKQPL